MGRSEAKATNQQALNISKQDQGDAQSALTSTNQAISDYTNKVRGFMNFGRATYGPNGEYMGALNTKATTAAAAGSRAMEGDLATRSLKTGENTAGYGAAVGEERRQASRDMTDTLAGGEQDRLNKLTAIEQYGVEADKLPASLYAGLYGTGTSAAVGALGPASSAATGSKGFGQTFGDAFATQLGQTLAGGKG